MPNDLAHLQDISESVLKQSLQKGATGAAVAASISEGLSVDVRLGETETVEYCEDHGFGITVFVGQQKGTVSTSDLSEKALNMSIDKALSIAKYTAPDPYSCLPEPAFLAKDWPDLSLHHPWNVSVDEAVKIAQKMESAALNFDSKIANSEGANVSAGQSRTWYVNSSGFSGGFETSRNSLSVSVVAGEKDQMQRDYDYSTARAKEDLTQPSAIGQSAAESAVSRLNARQVKTQQVPVLFKADVATGLIGSFLSAISGGNLYRKQSFLLDHLGKKIFPDFMDISEDPYVLKGLASSPYDGEGVAVKARSLIESGKLEGYLLSTYSAKRLNMQTTGNSGGPHNIFVKDTGHSFDACLKEMKTGLLVTELIGQGVNLITGDYSRGAAGFWVENGEIQFPVHEVTIAGNLKDMFQDIIAIGTDTERRGGVQVGSVLVKGMTVAGS